VRIKNQAENKFLSDCYILVSSNSSNLINFQQKSCKISGLIAGVWMVSIFFSPQLIFLQKSPSPNKEEREKIFLKSFRRSKNFSHFFRISIFEKWKNHKKKFFWSQNNFFDFSFLFQLWKILGEFILGLIWFHQISISQSIKSY